MDGHRRHHACRRRRAASSPAQPLPSHAALASERREYAFSQKERPLILGLIERARRPACAVGARARAPHANAAASQSHRSPRKHQHFQTVARLAQGGSSAHVLNSAAPTAGPSCRMPPPQESKPVCHTHTATSAVVGRFVWGRRKPRQNGDLEIGPIETRLLFLQRPPQSCYSSFNHTMPPCRVGRRPDAVRQLVRLHRSEADAWLR